MHLLFLAEPYFSFRIFLSTSRDDFFLFQHGRNVQIENGRSLVLEGGLKLNLNSFPDCIQRATVHSPNFHQVGRGRLCASSNEPRLRDTCGEPRPRCWHHAGFAERRQEQGEGGKEVRDSDSQEGHKYHQARRGEINAGWGTFGECFHSWWSWLQCTG